METYVFLRNRSDDEILSETHEMTMQCKRVMMSTTSTKMKRRQKIMIKKGHVSLVGCKLKHDLFFGGGAICYTEFFDLTISGNY